MFAAALRLASACRDGDDDLGLDISAVKAETDSCATFAFRFTLTTAAATRAEYVDENGNLRDDGVDTDWENYINIPDGDYRFYIFDTSDQYLFPLDPAANDGVESVVLDHTPTATATTYEVRARLNPSILNSLAGGFKVMMLANWRTDGYRLDATTYPALTSLDNDYPTFTPGTQVGTNNSGNIANAVFHWSHAPLSATHAIPMYGVMTVAAAEAAQLAPGGYLRCGTTLWLLRALVKIEVSLSESLAGSGIVIAECTLRNHNVLGFYAPWIYSWGSTIDTYLTRWNTPGSTMTYNGCSYTPLSIWLHACNNNATTQSGTYVNTTVATPFAIRDGNTAVIYTPEYQNDGTNNKTTVSFTLQYTIDGKTQRGTTTIVLPTLKIDGSINTADTNNNTAFKELHRNHSYQIVIETIASDLKAIRYTVCPTTPRWSGDIVFD